MRCDDYTPEQLEEASAFLAPGGWPCVRRDAVCLIAWYRAMVRRAEQPLIRRDGEAFLPAPSESTTHAPSSVPADAEWIRKQFLPAPSDAKETT